VIGLPLDVTFPRLEGIRWRYCTRWDEGPAAVLGMSLLRLGICRPNDWSGSAVDFVERGFRRFYSQNRAVDVKRVWVGEGQLMTPQMLLDLMAGLGRSVPAEILPARVLVRTAAMVVWWVRACERIMFFSDHGADPSLKNMNGKLYPHPPLLFKACGSHLWVRALAKAERPTAETNLCTAPYWNCYDNGVCCTGSMKIPQEKSVAAIDLWEESFFQSEFTHASGVRKHVHFRGGFLAMWEFVRNDDHSYRNDNRHED